MTSAADVDARVRAAVYSAFAVGRVPWRADVAAAVSLGIGDVSSSYERLAESHVLVLDPATREVWMAMPFSAVPTPFRVESSHAAWWAPCAWDALGIPVAVGLDARVTTACAQSGSPIVLHVESGELRGDDCVAHFAVRASRWWDDIGFT